MTAIQCVLCVYGFFCYKTASASQSDRNLRRPYIIGSFVILVLFSYVTVSDSIYLAELLFSNPGGAYEELVTTSSPWYLTMGEACSAMVTTIGDGILVRNCR